MDRNGRSGLTCTTAVALVLVLFYFMASIFSFTPVVASADKTNLEDAREKALGKIQAAENAVALANTMISSLPGAPPNAAKVLLEQAREHLQKAGNAFGGADYGKAYGLANSAERLARNAIRKLKEIPPGSPYISPDNVTVTASFAGDASYQSSNATSSGTASAVALSSTTLSISPSSFTLYSRGSTSLTATLASGGSVLVNKTITWSATGGSLSATSTTTNSSGQASVTYAASTVTAQTSVAITASFAGDSSYQSSSGTSVGTISSELYQPTPEWSIQVVDAVGTRVSIAVDSHGYPHISYASGSKLRYAYWTGNSWKTKTVDSNGFVGSSVSMDLDSADRPHIVYRAGPFPNENEVRYARWTGSSWEIQVVDSAKLSSVATIALDSSDRPHISYYDWGNGDLKYAYWTGSSWAIQVVDNGAPKGNMEPSIAVDSVGRPHIAYSKWPTGLGQILMYARWNGSAWEIQTVDTNGGSVGAFNSIALDSCDRPHISMMSHKKLY